MRSAGVDTSWLKRHETISSGIGFIILDENGVPAMVTSLGANAEIQERDIEQAYHDMPNAKVMLTQFEIPIDTALFAARQAKQRGMVVLLNPAPAPEGAIEGLDVADILLPNETEAQVLLGMEPGQAVEPRQMAISLRERSGVPVVIITLGEKGILGVDDKGVWTVSVPEVEVVDTSGAGDVFCAALAAGLSTGMELRQASWWACLAASFSVTKGGTIPAYPTLDELQKFINSQEIIVREI
jgi:ribokinase